MATFCACLLEFCFIKVYYTGLQQTRLSRDRHVLTTVQPKVSQSIDTSPVRE